MKSTRLIHSIYGPFLWRDISGAIWHGRFTARVTMYLGFCLLARFEEIQTKYTD